MQYWELKELAKQGQFELIVQCQHTILKYQSKVKTRRRVHYGKWPKHNKNVFLLQYG